VSPPVRKSIICGDDDVKIKGYTRKDGVRVKAHCSKSLKGVSRKTVKDECMDGEVYRRGYKTKTGKKVSGKCVSKRKALECGEGERKVRGYTRSNGKRVKAHCSKIGVRVKNDVQESEKEEFMSASRSDLDERNGLKTYAQAKMP
jgi:hypothetical protein